MTGTTSGQNPGAPDNAWQLHLFRRALKKKLKLAALLRHLGPVTGQQCLLLSCGDNSGALNWHFRRQGGHWTWGDVLGENLAEMSQFLGETVHQVPEGRFPFAPDEFDRVVAIDVLEHLSDDQPFLHELRRVLRPSGRAIVTVPNGDPGLWANRLKHRLGMTPAVYGHTRAGYTVAELQQARTPAVFRPVAAGGYSRFFTEMVELIINFGYVFVLARRRGGATPGQIAPGSAGELKRHGLAYRLYTLAYPLMWLISRLDFLLPASTNNAVIVVGVRNA